MKVEIVDGVCPAATGNYDILGTTPSFDMVGAIFWSGSQTTNLVNTSAGRFMFAATDLVNNVSLSAGATDAATGAAATNACMLSTTRCLGATNQNGVFNVAPVGSVVGQDPTGKGVRITTTAVTTGRLTKTLLISGTDAAMKVGSQYFASADGTHTQTHGLGGTPDVIIVLTSIDIASNTNELAAKGLAIGMYDRSSGNMTAVSYHITSGVNPTDNAARLSNARVADVIGATGVSAANLTISNLTSTTFDIVQNTASGVNCMVGWIALRGVGSQMFSTNLLATLPTSTGNIPLVTGMSGKPQVVFTFPTRIVSGNTPVNDDSAGSLGVSCGVTNDYASSTQGACAWTFKYGVVTSVARNYNSITEAMLSTDNTGAKDLSGTIATWNSDGVSINYVTVPATAFLAPVLAFGMPASANLPMYPFARTQFFVEDRVVFG